MINKIFTLTLCLLSFQSCVENRILSNNDSSEEIGDSSKENIVIQHISAQPDGLHPYNSNSSVQNIYIPIHSEDINKA